MKKKTSKTAGERPAVRARASTRPKPRESKAKRAARGSRLDTAVSALLRELDHPLASEIDAVRRMLLDVDATIVESVKWNAPSFRTVDFFATIHLRNRDAVQLVFHTGAKAKTRTKDLEIADPRGLVKWLAKDRCLVTLGSGKEIAANRAAFESIVRAWIRQL